MKATAIRAAQIIRSILYITIASVDEKGQPWNTPVYSAFDKDLNFYWCSDINSHHSSNIRINPKIFIVIYDSTVPEGTGEGVYIEAEAAELRSQADTMDAVSILDKRVGKTKERDYINYSSDAPLRAYRAESRKMWMNADEFDQHGQWLRDLRREIRISDLKGQL